MKKLSLAVVSSFVLLFPSLNISAQEELETGGKKMPNEWIDKDTKHKIIKLTRNGASNLSFYFHNNPFIGNKMVYYSSIPSGEATDRKIETYNTNTRDKQLHLLDLNTLQSEQLTYHSSPMNGEIIHAGSKNIYYQIKDSVYCVS